MRARITQLSFVGVVAALFLLDAVAAQLAPIGLSEVRGQWLELPAAEAPVASPEGLLGDRFGYALAVGDFNGDNAEDLATGAPGVNDFVLCGGIDCGVVVVRYGSPAQGFGNSPEPLILREAPGASTPLEFFGGALAAGDFDGDGYDDLAAGIPGNQPGTRGAVQIYFGSSAGLQGTGGQFLNEALTGQASVVCDGSVFGSSLAAGNFDADPYVDLVIGVPASCEFIDVAPVPGGAVYVAHGGAGGLVPFVGYRISQYSFGIFEDPEANDRFGEAVATGDFNHDTFDDLAIGIPAEDNQGAIEIIMGSQDGLLFAQSAFWYPGALGEVGEAGDRLGASLATGDFDGDDYIDLAIGNWSEDLSVPIQTDAGQVTIAYGSASGFDLGRTGHLAQSSFTGDGGDEQASDNFGWAIAAGDFDGDGFSDLAIGHPGESEYLGFQGAVTVALGAPAGLAPANGYRILYPGRQGIPGDSFLVPQDFGFALATGDFDDTGFSDLAIGAPSVESVGGEAILYGSLFADGLEIATTGRWSSAQP